MIRKWCAGAVVLMLAAGTVGCDSGTSSGGATTGSTGAYTEDGATETADEASEDAVEVTENGQLVWEDSGVKISYKGIDLSGYGNSPVINMYIENNSDINIDVEAKNISVNNYFTSTSESVISGLSSGESTYNYMYVCESLDTDGIMSAIGKISDIKNLELDIAVSSYDTNEVIAESQPLVITFKDTTPGKVPEIESVKLKSEMSADEIGAMDVTSNLGDAFAECNGVKFYSTSTVKDDYNDIEIGMVIDNVLDKDCYVDFDDITLNGSEYSEWGYYFKGYDTVIPAGKKLVTVLKLAETYFTEANINVIDDIKELKGTIEIKDASTKDTIAKSDVVTIIGS
jgi:hypothetical protein